MKTGAFLALLAVLVAALAFAGCGGDDETSSLTRAEFIKQVNAGCKEHEEERAELFKTVTSTMDPTEVTRADQEKITFEVTLPPYEKDIENIKSLGAPAGDEKQVEEIVKAMEKTVEDVEAKPLESLRNRVQFADASKLKKEYGLTDCGL